MHITQEKSQPLKSTHYIIPALRHWKRLNCGDKKKISGYQRSGRRTDDWAEHRTSRPGKLYHGGYMSLFMCQDPWNVQPQEQIPV